MSNGNQDTEKKVCDICGKLRTITAHCAHCDGKLVCWNCYHSDEHVKSLQKKYGKVEWEKNS